jgi:hypothetical protein
MVGRDTSELDTSELDTGELGTGEAVAALGDAYEAVTGLLGHLGEADFLQPTHCLAGPSTPSSITCWATPDAHWPPWPRRPAPALTSVSSATGSRGGPGDCPARARDPPPTRQPRLCRTVSQPERVLN